MKDRGEPFFTHQVILSPLGGTASYAVPKMVVSGNGTLLLFVHQRLESNRDFGFPKNGLLLRSQDGGRSWLPPMTIAHIEGMDCRPLGAVVDREIGKIIVFIKNVPLVTETGQRIDERWFVANEDRAYGMGLRWYVIESRDDGTTWSEMRDITDQLRGHSPPQQGAFMPNMTGVQLTQRRAGRLVVPARVWMNGAFAWENTHNCVIFSDDHGESWRRGGIAQSHVGEATVAELPDGRLYLNNRNHSESKGIRSHAISSDGGETFTEFADDPDLIEPTCHASVFRYERDIYLFSNPASRQDRHRMTVRASLDGCRSWPLARLINPGPAAYSSLVVANDGTIVCAYETGVKSAREKIAVACFNFVWLEQGESRP